MRARILTTAATALVVSAPALAIDANVNTNLTTLSSTISGTVVVGNGLPQTNTGNVTADIDLGSFTTVIDGIATGSVVNSNNIGTAFAAGNRLGVIADLGTLTDTVGNNNGLAVVTSSVNTAVIVSGAFDVLAGANLTGFTTGSVDVSRNSIAATTIINDGSNGFSLTINGALPVGYAATSTDAASISGANVNGTIIASNNQVTTSAGSIAIVADNAIGLTITEVADGDSTVNAAATLDENRVAASFTGNTRTATIALDSELPSFGGTAVIANRQLFDTAAGTASGFNSATSIAGSIAGAGAGLVTFENSALSVSDNRISSAARGNEAVSTISLADGLSFDRSHNVADTSGSFLSGSAIASGDLVIGSFQRSGNGISSILVAATGNAEITATVQNPDGSSVVLADNAVTATTINNSTSSTFRSGESAAVFDGSVALANNQAINAMQSNAFVTDTVISVELGDALGAVVGSSATIDSNLVESRSTGNQASQSISLAAANIVTGDDITTFSTQPATLSTSTIGAVVIGSAQYSVAAPVTAGATGTRISLTSADADGVNAGVDLSVVDNTQRAAAQGNISTNSISLAGTSVGSEAGTLNFQNSDALSGVTATTSGSALLAVDGAAGDPAGPAASLTMTGNLTTASAVGAATSNSLSVDAVSVAVAGGSTDQFSVLQAVDPIVVSAAFAGSNVQIVNGAISATATPLADEAAFAVTVGTDVNASGVTNSRNTLSASAIAADASNSLDLDIGTLAVTGPGTDAGIGFVVNVQAVGGDVTATAAPDGEAVVLTDIGSAVLGGSVSTSGNNVLATASGALATNSIAADFTSLTAFDAAGATSQTGSVVGVSTAGAFTLVNTQANAAATEVTATLVADTPAAVTDSALVNTRIGSEVDGSSILSDNNALTAVARNMEASNTLALSGTSLQTTAALLSVQGSQADVSALIGSQVTAGALNAGGVLVEIGTEIASSDVSVGGNRVFGEAFGNMATNSLSVAATTLTGSNPGFGAGPSDPTYSPARALGATIPAVLDATATGDLVLSNAQVVQSVGSSTAEVFATFGIDQEIGQLLTDSSLSVSSNVQVARAMSNSATNQLAVTATNIDGSTAALANTQGLGVATTVDASSDMVAFANAASAGSSIALDGNINAAFGMFNVADNRLSVSATNIGGMETNAAGNVGEATANVADAFGSFALANVQSTTSVAPPSVDGGVLNTTATTNIFNTDRADLTTAGLVNGVVSMSGNLTVAESAANTATNRLAVSAAASSQASAALVNDQYSTADVSAGATANVGMTLATAAADPASSGSAISVDGNATQAIARGNNVANTMVFDAGTAFGVLQNGAGAEAQVSGGSSANAQAAMLNRQDNVGDVGASATAAYGVALNAAGTGAGVLNGAVSVSGNSVQAAAFGNQAVNRMEMAVLNTGNASAAFNNLQSNTGVITASATSVTFNVNVTGAVTNGAFRNVGNNAAASAVGNSSITTIIGR